MLSKAYYFLYLCPSEAARGSIPACKEDIETLIAELLLVPGFLDKSINEHVILRVLVFRLFRLRLLSLI
ncbi:hypothetical protein GGP41_009502 [Bipolaris sorokiniana]|uniref:Uncharacterized protein n=1 Tax=Cochliobolus sativus TaxID=45130 RepID=A0A8H5ZAH3_COCSA|nr:hypothetical protein GGP41_009502 [Bipolaris sorokiniana]